MDRPPGSSASTLLRRLASLLLVGALLGSCTHRPQRPDIVLVVWDTCRADRTEVDGYRLPTTPRLRELAKEGTTFRNCYTPASWTPPAHASLFTGLLPRHHGMRQGTGGDRINPGIPLLAETLRAAGYETVSVSANPMVSRSNGLTAGFDSDLQAPRGDDPAGTGEEVVAHVRGWLSRRSASAAARPFFLFVNLMECHQPYVAEASAVAAVRGDGAVNGARRAAEAVTMRRTSRHIFGGEPMDPALYNDLDAAYDGAVRLDDRWTGEILDALGAAGRLENAFVAVCGDHGENLGEHGELSHLMSVYEPVLRVPLVVRWPARIEGGLLEDGVVRLQDLYPTILEAAAVPVPAACGKDALSLAQKPLGARPVVAEHGPSTNALPEARLALPNAPAEVFERFEFLYRAVRDPSHAPGALKLVQVLKPVEGGEPILVREEMFDLSTDPGETRNLLHANAPDRLRAAAERLRAMGEAGR